jgi:hypothetical protein
MGPMLPWAAQFGNPAVTYNQSFRDRDTIDRTQLMNPMWAQWLDTLQGNAGGKNIKLAGGPSAPGSNQIRGVGQQPSMAGLQSLVTPTTETPTSYTPTFENPTRPKVRR